MDEDGCPCGCGRSTSTSDLNGHEDACPTSCGPAQIAVRVSNSDECGRQSGWAQILGVPPPEISGDELDDWLHEHAVTGGGHPCGSRENACYEIEIAAAPGRSELVGSASGTYG